MDHNNAISIYIYRERERAGGREREQVQMHTYYDENRVRIQKGSGKKIKLEHLFLWVAAVINPVFLLIFCCSQLLTVIMWVP